MKVLARVRRLSILRVIRLAVSPLSVVCVVRLMWRPALGLTANIDLPLP